LEASCVAARQAGTGQKSNDYQQQSSEADLKRWSLGLLSWRDCNTHTPSSF